MLVIRKEQMEIFSSHLLGLFLSDALAFLKNQFPETAGKMNDVELKTIIQKGIDKSEKYSITNRKDVLMYLKLMFTNGYDFDEDPSFSRMSKILRTRNLSGENKIERLLK
jgi:hypothetical protein